jgi:hypothetical protein
MKSAPRNLQALVIAVSSLWLLVIGVHRAHLTIDFVPVYTGARCLLNGCNPYDTAQLDAQYFQSGGPAAQRPDWKKTPPVYLPSTFLVISPLAMFRLPVARVLWVALNALLFIACVVFVWSQTPPSSRWLPTILGSLFLITPTSLHLIGSGQPAAFAISLVIIGTLLYLRNRYIPLATVLLMLSLAVKPQMGGLIVLYLLFRKIHWRQAALALGGALALFLLAGLMLKLQPASAHWASDLRAGLADSEKPGSPNDPRPTNREAMLANLQAVTSVFVADEKSYKALSYGIVLAMLAVWMIGVLKSNSGLASHYLALAALSVISLLPVYHRDYDARLLVLTIPAISIIYQRRRLFGAIVAAAAILQIVSISIQLPVQAWVDLHGEAQGFLRSRVLFVLLMRQQEVELLVLAGLYLAAMFIVRVPAGGAMEDPSAIEALDSRSNLVEAASLARKSAEPESAWPQPRRLTAASSGAGAAAPARSAV